MKRRRLAGAVAAFAISSAPALARAAEPTAVVAVDGRIGQSTAPYFTAAFPRTSGYGGFLVMSGRVRVAERLRLGLRVPLVLMRVEQPAGALYAEAAWANPELNLSLEQPWLERDGWQLALTGDLAVGAPLAEHDPAQLAGRALRLANALEGFSEPALFTPGVLPLTPASALTLRSARWKFAGSLSVPLLVRVSDAALPTESGTRSLAIVPVVALEAELRVWPWLSLACAPRLTVQALSPASHDEKSRVQLLAAGRADFHVARRIALSASLQAPLGGALGGETVAGGLALRGNF